MGMWFVGIMSAWAATIIGRTDMAATATADAERKWFLRDMGRSPSLE